MLKNSMLQLVWHILEAIICFIVSLILIALVSLVLSWFGVDSTYLNNPIWVSVAFAIPTLILYIIFGWAFYMLPVYYDPHRDKPNQWSKRMREGKPLYYREAIKQCAPYMCIAFVIVVLRFALWNILNDAIMNGLLEAFQDAGKQDTAKQLNLVFLGLLACYTVITLASIVELPVACCVAACPKCRNIGGYVYECDAGSEVVKRTTWKEEVDTGRVSDVKTTVTTTHKVQCRCRFCGERKIENDRHRPSESKSVDS